jgi:hypothetical protein
MPRWLLKFSAFLADKIFNRIFTKMPITEVDIKPGHSYIVMCNHFGFLDGILAFYLATKVIRKKQDINKVYIMSVKKQMQKNKILRYLGSFSVEPGKLSINESFNYAAEVLSQPGNVLLFFPQGKLESCHIRHIQFEDGLAHIVPRIKGDCQLLWSSNILEYFESMWPSIYFNMLDCGTNHDFDFEALKNKVNQHHQLALQSTVRFTAGP